MIHKVHVVTKYGEHFEDIKDEDFHRDPIDIIEMCDKYNNGMPQDITILYLDKSGKWEYHAPYVAKLNEKL